MLQRERRRRRIGTEIALLSDEAYAKNRVRTAGGARRGPAQYYSNTFVLYSYGKTAGSRPASASATSRCRRRWPAREPLREAMMIAPVRDRLRVFRNALFATTRLAEIEPLSIDVGAPRNAAVNRLVPAPDRDGLRDDSARRHLLRAGALARCPTTLAFTERPRRARHLRAARNDPRAAGLVPHLAHRQRRDGRAQPAGVRSRAQKPHARRIAWRSTRRREASR